LVEPDLDLNPILSRMAEGRTALGLTLRMVGNPETLRVARASGHHFVRIDNQHGVFDLETVAAVAGAGLSSGTGTLVRARGADDPDVALLLDVGIGGVVFPDIEEADQARAAVSATRFPPLGARSYGGTYPHFDYRGLPVDEAMSRLDRTTLVGCMIESARGMDQVAEIAAVPGLDLLHLGMSDLLISMGIPGDYDSAELWSALDRIIDVAADRGLHVGCGGAPTVDHQAEAIRRGARLVTTRADVNFLLGAAGDWVSALSDQLGDQI
jgi:staphyloferrin B biosynthesis citrate synthase